MRLWVSGRLPLPCAYRPQQKPQTILSSVLLSRNPARLPGTTTTGPKTAQIFIDDVNAKGGILGKKLRAVFADTKSDRAEGAKAGQEVVSQGADLVVGTCDYDFGAPALLQAQKAGKISVFLCAEDAKAGVAGVGPYAFTAGVAAQLEGASLAEWGYDKQGTETSTSFSTTA